MCFWLGNCKVSRKWVMRNQRKRAQCCHGRGQCMYIKVRLLKRAASIIISVSFHNGVFSYRQEFAPLRSKFFPLRAVPYGCSQRETILSLKNSPLWLLPEETNSFLLEKSLMIAPRGSQFFPLIAVHYGCSHREPVFPLRAVPRGCSQREPIFSLKSSPLWLLP